MWTIVYSLNMTSSGLNKGDAKTGKRVGRRKNDLVDFVAEQFKQLSKKNIRVPIKLYHL